MSEWNLGIMPMVVFIAWVSAELLSWDQRRSRGAKRKGDPSLGLWLLRPWALWPLVNLIFRMTWEEGYNNLTTFPFFANLWFERSTMSEWLAVLAESQHMWAWGSVALLAIGVLMRLVWVGLSDDRPATARRCLPRVAALCLGFMALSLSIGSTPQGGLSRTPSHFTSLIGSWKPHSSMLYTLPLMNSSTAYMKRFVEYQESKFLSRTIHAQSHPPFASLSLSWVASAAGYSDHSWTSIRAPAMRQRLTIAMCGVGAFIVLLLYALGRMMTGQVRVGFLSASLWLAMPTVLAYTPFSQDIVYTVFFVTALLLTWRIGSSERPPWGSMIALGLCFTIMVFMSFSWCIVTSIFAVFLALMKKQKAWGWRNFLIRVCVPLTIMTLLSAQILYRFKMNYWKMYQISSDYVNGEWYLELREWGPGILGWVGGQMELFLMMGAVTFSAFCVAMVARFRDRNFSPQTVFVCVILGIYILPILFGPLPLRMEVARCWMWVLAVPVVLAAEWMVAHCSPRFCAWAVGSSAFTYLVMRQFIDVAP